MRALRVNLLKSYYLFLDKCAIKSITYRRNICTFLDKMSAFRIDGQHKYGKI